MTKQSQDPLLQIYLLPQLIRPLLPTNTVAIPRTHAYPLDLRYTLPHVLSSTANKYTIRNFEVFLLNGTFQGIAFNGISFHVHFYDSKYFSSRLKFCLAVSSSIMLQSLGKVPWVVNRFLYIVILIIL